MKKELQLCLVEYNPIWESIEENLYNLSELLIPVKDKDIYILPEMFNTGFSQNASNIAEPMEGKTINWLKELSISKQVAICGSLAIYEDNKFYNRFVFVDKGKIKAIYDKHHLFGYGGESVVFSSGSEKVIFEYYGWKICPMICYDLRFPVWNRNDVQYDLMINVANWPMVRTEAWDTLLKARAIENMAFICGVNRQGIDGNDLEYNGHSAVYSPIGERIYSTNSNNCIHVSISLEDIKKYRDQYRFLEDMDPFELK